MSDFKIKGSLIVEGAGLTVAGSQVSTPASTETLTNKTINADNNTISNLADANIKVGAAIDAAKIADGSVSNAEFQYLGGVTSDIQAQLDAKVDENAPIVGGTKTKITYDSKGLVTAGADATTSDIAEGTNLYFTDARAKAAAVSDAIVDGVTDVAPSQNAVFDALAGKADVSHTHAISDITGLQTALDNKVDDSEKGAANGVATLGADGKLTASQIPAIAITDTFVVANEAAMLALSTAEQGDVAVRTDLNKSFILVSGLPSVLGNWQELLSPTDQVQSVNGQTGTVVLDTDDINEGASNLYFTDTRAKTAAVVNSTAGNETDQAASVSAMKSYVTGITANLPQASTGDINETEFTMANNQSLSANVTGLAFANATVRSFKALVSVEVDATADLFEAFELIGVQKGAGWDMAVTATGDNSQVVFTITSAGQIQYVSADYPGFVDAKIKFRAITTSK